MEPALEGNTKKGSKRWCALTALFVTVAVAAFASIESSLAGTITALEDSARTAPGTPVVIAILANDADTGRNQLAVLKVTAPAHGTVAMNSEKAVLPPDLTHVIEFATT